MSGYGVDLSGLFVWLVVFALVGGVAFLYGAFRFVVWCIHHVRIV